MHFMLQVPVIQLIQPVHPVLTLLNRLLGAFVMAVVTLQL
jgi:hypothetical protein